jgi:hypothetical protein
VVVKEEEWVCVSSKKGISSKRKSVVASAVAAPSSSSSAAAAGLQDISQGRFSSLRTSAAHKVAKGGLLPKTTNSFVAAKAGGAATATGGGGGGANSAAPVDPSKLSKSALKRYKKKQQHQQEQVLEAPVTSTTGATTTTNSYSSMKAAAVAGPSTPPLTPMAAGPPSAGSSCSSLSSLHSSSSQQQQQQGRKEDEWTVAGRGGKALGLEHAVQGAPVQPQKKKVDPLVEMLKTLAAADHRQLIQSTTAAAAVAGGACSGSNGTGGISSNSNCNSSSTNAWGVIALEQLSLPCGLFSSLPRDALLAILTLLTPKDLAVLSQCCQGLNAWCNDGALWQELVQCHFPRHRVTASQMCDWKTAYVMESNSLLEGLRCWHTRVGFEEDVLGLPVTFTKNPKTGAVDYILAHPDLISMTAFKAGVRQTPERVSVGNSW